jgi:hypothetical protein
MILMQMGARDLTAGTDRFHLIGLNFKNDFVIEKMVVFNVDSRQT